MRRLLERWADTLERLAPGVRTTRPYLAPTVIALHAIVLAWIWSDDHPWIDAMISASHGWIEFTLPVSLVGFVVVVVVGLRLWGGVPLASIGLSRAGLGTAVAGCLALWLAFQLAGVLAVLIADVPFELGAVSDRTASGAIAALLAQLAGNALFEETVYRGYLLPRMMDLARARMSPGRAVVVAVAASSLVFTFVHLPHRLAHDFTTVELLGSLGLVWVLGVAMSVVYAWSSNLWLVIGVHALLNTPTILVDPI